jgi:hypothetical protein
MAFASRTPLADVTRWSSRAALRQALLVGGILASLLLVAADVINASRYQGYSAWSQAISELSAVGAPTRRLAVVLGAIYLVLIVAFGSGVWIAGRRAAPERGALRVTGALLIAYGIVQLAWFPFPMSMRGAEPTFTDTMHIVVTAVTVLLIVSFIAFGAAARRGAFRVYSVGTIVVTLLFGAWTALDAPGLAAGLPTPWMGLKERICYFAPVLWTLVFAAVLLRAGTSGRSETPHRVRS